MADEVKKPAEAAETSKTSTQQPNKVTETAAEKDQAEKFRALRRELLKKELAFSFSRGKLPGSGAKMEITGEAAQKTGTEADQSQPKPETRGFRIGKPAEGKEGTDAPADAKADQTEATKARRQQLAKSDANFSMSALLRGQATGAKFELTDGEKPAPPAAKTVSDTRAQTAAAPAKPEAHPLGEAANPKPEAQPKPVDMNEAAKDAEAIRKATGNDNYVARWADRDAINKILEGKTEAERQAIDQIYKQKYGKGLEEEMRGFEKGSDLDKFLNVLHRSDNNAENSAARRIHQDLAENKNWIEGRSGSEIAKDIRDLVSTKNAAQIAKLDEEYKKTYGTSLKDAIASDDKIPQSTKDMVAIYLKGNDKRTDGDTAQLIDIALKEKSTDLFSESMRDASPAARKAFLDNGGEQKVDDAFGHWYSNKDVQHAMDYAKEGKLSAATQVKDNTGIVFDNAKGVELAINRMSDEERKMYLDGKSLQEGKPVKDLKPADQEKARNYYNELHTALTKTANAEEMTKYENMIAKRPEAAKSVVEEVKDSHHWYGGYDTDKVLSSISSMSPEDQQKYRSDEKFRAQLDQMVSTSLKEPQELDAAHRMLQLVKDGKAPDSDVIANLEKSQGNTGDAVRAVQKAFHDDPQLQERVVHPKTDEDRKFAELFKKTAQSSFGDDYDQFGKALVEKGHVPLEDTVGLNKGVFSNDYKQAFEDLQHATAEEKQRLKTDPAYQEKVLGFMDENRRQIAMATLDQKELAPQDNIRAAVLGWGGSSDVVDELKKIKPEDLAQAKADYAHKYGSSLEGDVMKKLGGSDRDAAERIFAQNLSLDDQANIARNQTENARSGVGAYLSDNVWRSGTGAQADDAQNQTDRALSEKSKMEADIASGSEMAKNMSPEQIQQVQQRLAAQVRDSIKFENTSTDNHVESKKQAAEYVGDAAIMTAAIGSMILTGGADAPLVIGLAVAGAGIKVGTNAALEGNNYDFSVGQVAKDATIGSITAATAVIGPGEIAAVFGVGKAAATEAAGLAVASIGEHVLVTGGKEALENGTKEIVANALASGAKKLETAQFEALANKVVSTELTGAAREQAVKELAANLEKNVSERMATGMVRQFTQHGLNAGGGALAGGAGGAAQGATEWDSRDTVAQNLAKVGVKAGEGAISGAITGGAVSAGMAGAGRVISAARNSVSEAARTSAAEGGGAAARDAAEHLRTGGETPRVPGDAAGAGSDATRAAGGAAVTTGAAETTEEADKKVVDETAKKGSDDAARKAVEETTGGTHKTPEVEGTSGRTWPANEKGQVLDSKGNVLEHDWPKVETNKVAAVRAQVRQELGDVKAAGGQSVLEKLDNSPLSEAQKARVLDSLGEVREHYARTFGTDVDQPVNWIHTQGELGRVLDAAKAAGLTPAQTEDAMLASMFSDSLKTKANFTTHHIDGELAAEHVLKGKLGGDFTPERLDGILHAIQEHQIAPPAFMAMIYGGAIRRSIAAEGGRALTEKETGELGSLLKKMSDPFHAPTVDAPGGGKMLDLSDGEKALLARTGTDKWNVPSEGTPWNKISRALIDGDGIDNYATPGGLSKIIQIRGPETGPFFKDGNFRYENPDRVPGKPPSSSQESWRDSFDDFAKVASPDGLKVAESAAKDAEQKAVAAQARVDAWLHEKLGVPADKELPTIPGWTGKPKLEGGVPVVDAHGMPVMQPDNLKYPDYDQKWWDIHNKPAGKRTAEENAFYDDPANRYKGLNEKEIQDFKLAKEIRDRYAQELRKEQRVAGDAAPVFKPVPEVEGTNGRKWPANDKGQVLDSKNNVLEHEWPKVEANKVEAVRTQVRQELGQVKAAGGGSVLEKLDNSPLSEAQKTRVLDSLGEVREHYARTFGTDVDQPVNWIHTQGELGRVLDAAKAAGLTPAQTEDAMLASMFSDSLKTKANFTTHHLDGELAAEHVLKGKLGGDFTPERLDGILHAIQEHQIAPPAFMAMIYGGAIKKSIAAEGGRALTEKETGTLGTLLKKMSDPFHAPQVDAPGGGKMLALSDEEKALLARTGTDKWIVPSEGNAWNKISRALIDGDGIDNYATPGGLSKIIQIRGPETGPFFKDGNFRYENPNRVPGKPPSSSQESWRDSFDDFAKVASPDGLKVAESAAKDAEQKAVAAQARVDAWLHEKLGVPADKELPTIPGWTGKPALHDGAPMVDARGLPVMQPDNLKYPDYDQKWWDIHNTPAGKRTAEQNAFYADPANRYKGLNEKEIQDFNFAKEIRDRYVQELRKEQRVAGDAAPEFHPVKDVPPVKEPVTEPAHPEVEGTNGRKWPANEKGQVLDSKGNVLEHDWPKVEADKVEAVRTQVQQELGQVKAAGGQSVLEKLNNSPLSDAQKSRVLDSLGEVREHYARTFGTDVDQPVNWIHTQGELGRVLDAAKAAGLTPAQTEDAMLASMFSDSLKTKANFTTHHIDGELAAEHVLKGKLGGDFTPERLDGILHAIQEHQIAPPAFMSMIYGGAIVRSKVAEYAAKNPGMIQEDLALYEKLMAKDPSLLSLKQKISDPFHSPQVDAPGGGKMLALTDEEKALLARTGTDKWIVPSEGNPWNKISRALIDGDGIDNYATPGGLSKIIQIRGPETGPYFKDGNFRYENPGRVPGKLPSSSQESWRDSFDDFAKVASPDGLKVAQSAAKDAELRAVAAQSRVDAWLHEKLGVPADQKLPTIPGWTGKPHLEAGKPVLDSHGNIVMEPDNLKYPDYEQSWWDIHNKPLSKRTKPENDFYEDPAHKYRGLSEKEIADFKLAKEIRDRYAQELRKEQRVAGDAAPNYQPVP